MISFKQFLNEMPAYAVDIYNLDGYKEAVKTYIKEILKENPEKKYCSVNDSSVTKYSLSKKFFVFYSEDKILAFIKYIKKNKTMFVEQIENLSSEKGLSLKMYLFILKNRLFREIETGDILSDKNVSAHKSMIGKTTPFKFYIRDLDTEEDVQIFTSDDIQKEIKNDDMSKVFVIKENFDFVKVLSDRLNTPENTLIENMIQRMSNDS